MTSDTHTESYERSPFVDLRALSGASENWLPRRARREMEKKKRNEGGGRERGGGGRERKNGRSKKLSGPDRNTRMQKAYAAVAPRAKRA